MDVDQDVYSAYNKAVPSRIYKGRRTGNTVKKSFLNETAVTRRRATFHIRTVDGSTDSVTIGAETFGCSPRLGYSINKKKRWQLVGDSVPRKEFERKAKREALEDDSTLLDREYQATDSTGVLQDYNDEKTGISANVLSIEEAEDVNADRYARAFGKSKREPEQDPYDVWLSEISPTSQTTPDRFKTRKSRKGINLAKWKKAWAAETPVDEDVRDPVDFAIIVARAGGQLSRDHRASMYESDKGKVRAHKYRHMTAD